MNVASPTPNGTPQKPREQLHLRMVPRETRTFDTPFGVAGITVGTGDREVVMTMTPAAADQLAKIIASSARLHDNEFDQSTWVATMIDLLSCAAFCDGPLPEPRLVPLRRYGAGR